MPSNDEKSSYSVQEQLLLAEALLLLRQWNDPLNNQPVAAQAQNHPAIKQLIANLQTPAPQPHTKKRSSSFSASTLRRKFKNKITRSQPTIGTPAPASRAARPHNLTPEALLAAFHKQYSTPALTAQLDLIIEAKTTLNALRVATANYHACYTDATPRPGIVAPLTLEQLHIKSEFDATCQRAQANPIALELLLTTELHLPEGMSDASLSLDSNNPHFMRDMLQDATYRDIPNQLHAAPRTDWQASVEAVHQRGQQNTQPQQPQPAAQSTPRTLPAASSDPCSPYQKLPESLFKPAANDATQTQQETEETEQEHNTSSRPSGG